MVDPAGTGPLKRSGTVPLLATAVLVLSLFLFAVPLVDAKVLVFDESTNGSTIQSAMDAAGTGDLLLLKGGTYHENLTINESITVGALDKNDPPVIDSPEGVSGIALYTDGITVENLRITGKARYGILIRSDDNKVTNVSISGFPIGIGLISAGHNEITRNFVTNNSLGIDMDTGSIGNTIFLNYFDNPKNAATGLADLSWSSLPWRYQYAGNTFSGSLGNFWMQYTGKDQGGDGIGDTPYVIQDNGQDPGNQTADRAPLVDPPGAYTLLHAEDLPSPTPGTNALPPPSGTLGLPPPGVGGPAGPGPDLFMYLFWIVPVAAVLSIVAGIVFERTRRRSRVDDENFLHQEPADRHKTVVSKPVGNPEDGSPPEDHYYTVRLPVPLEQKYPGAEYIGEGGIARVFRANDADGRPIALKIPIRYDEITGTHFTKEIHLWQGLHHQNIVRINSANIFPVPYIEIEYVGRSLATVPLPVRLPESAKIVLGVAEGLRYAHNLGIIHRDIKPENILLAEDGTPKITDWGLAKATADVKQTGLISYSLEFAAPEQLAPNRYGETGPWTDLYQLGVVFFTIITGHVPFTGSGVGEITHAILNEDPGPVQTDLPEREQVRRIIDKCLMKRPENRYRSAEDLIKDLGDLIDALCATGR